MPLFKRQKLSMFHNKDVTVKKVTYNEFNFFIRDPNITARNGAQRFMLGACVCQQCSRIKFSSCSQETRLFTE